MVEEAMGTLRFTNEEAVQLSRERIHFSFGENWKKYLSGLDETIIKHAEDSFRAFTRLSRLDDYTFLDIGCGSGLSSLVAYRLGAKRVVSVDIDPNSIDCVTVLRARFASGTNTWDILQGSVLDRSFLTSLGAFSYVYSWGVLHHTGSMWQALDNVTDCVKCAGKLHIALYNEHKNSAKWLQIKRICNRWHRTLFPLAKVSLVLLTYVRMLSRLQSPTKFVRQYAEKRGMTFRRDIEDWLGGLPYEYCKPDQVVDFLSDRGFVALRLRTAASIGCNEFLFRSDFCSKRDM
jgi:2-polyprenyl-6-hydroxyphenyl methylase/3-demethylubiquinone-9 3-methyltransferase